MAIVFPASPSVNDTFTEGSITYKWDGDKWIGLGVTPADRLVEGSNSLEINASNNLVWTGNNVGIGTTNPGVKLDVHGNSAAVRVFESPDGADIRVVAGGSTGYIGTYSLDNLQILSGGATAIIANTSQNVGIGGDITPDVRLHINGANAYPATSGTTPTGFIALRNATGATHGAYIGVANAAPWGTWIQAQDKNNLGTSYPILLNPNGGNVGIGTASPNGTLTVEASSGRMLTFRNPTTGTGASDGSYIALGGSDLQISNAESASTIFYTADTERLRITSDGHKSTNEGSIFHGSNDITDFTGASRNSYNNVSIRAGYAGGDTSPSNRTSAIKIYPVGIRNTTAGTLTGGIAWQHLDPNNSSWSTSYGEGAQIWMGAAIHDVPGAERDRFNLWMNSATTGNSQPNNLAIEAYPNGMVRHPKVPAFHTSGNSSALVNSTNTIIVGNTVDVNNGSCYDSSNGRFVAPIDGIYQFSFWGLLYPYASGVMNIFYSKNGIQWADLIQGGADSDSHTSRAGTVIMSMSANDYAELRINRGTASGSAYGSQWNMCGFLIG